MKSRDVVNYDGHSESIQPYLTLDSQGNNAIHRDCCCWAIEILDLGSCRLCIVQTTHYRQTASNSLTAVGCLPACIQYLITAKITEPTQAKQTDSDRQPITQAAL